VSDIVKARHKGAPPTDTVETLLAKADEALARGDFNSAERLYGQATVAKPASPEAWYGKGRTFALQEEWDKALRCFSIAVKFSPGFGNAWAGLAAAHLHQGDKEKAREAVEKAKSLNADPARIEEIQAALQ
jgi:tetratricopeptide (TPR) repeat protein